jgi:hypothetical protein
MGVWKGIIKLNNVEVEAGINYTIPQNAFLVKWEGSFITPNKLQLDKDKEYSTNIGKLIINNIQENSEKKYYYHFEGVENPTGPLAIEIGKDL